jgi:hypothetical protein
MSNVRSFTNPFEIVDLTNEVNLIPNQWGKLREDGLFAEESIAQNTLNFESTSGTIAVIPDQVRGARNNVNKDDNRIVKAFSLTHHPLDDYITPQDIAGKRAYGSDNVETADAVTARKLARIRMNHAITLEAARWHTLTTGTQFNPSGTIGSLNFFTDFGVTQKSIDFVLSTAGTEVQEKSEEGIAHIQDNILSGEVATGFTVYCSPEFFGKLIKQAGVKEAYKYYTSTQEVLRQRAGGTGVYRSFVHGSVTYVEIRGSYNGSRHIPANEGVMVPTGTLDCFKTFFGPANKFGLTNTLGEQAYVWQYRDAKDTKIELESESNFLNLLARPQVVVKCTTSN